MDEDDVGRPKLMQERACLGKICVSREGDVVHSHVEGDDQATEKSYLFRLVQDCLCKSSLDDVTGNDARVLLVLAPDVEELS